MTKRSKDAPVPKIPASGLTSSLDVVERTIEEILSDAERALRLCIVTIEVLELANPNGNFELSVGVQNTAEDVHRVVQTAIRVIPAEIANRNLALPVGGGR